MLACEVGEPVLEEHEADHVLERLRLGVALDVLLAHQRLHAGDGSGVVADAAEDLRRDVAVELLEPGAPFQVADAVAREFVARDLPAPDVLAARRQFQRLGGVRREALEPLGHLPRIDELLRRLRAVDGDPVRIGGVG